MSDIDNIRRNFDRDTLARVCVMPEKSFGRAYGMDRVAIDQPAPEDFYFFKDNGSNVLAVAHLDTVGMPDERAARFIETEAGEVVYSRALDDRLGAYIILELLPRLGIEYDILLTVGEESGLSTAAGFSPPEGKEYDWMIEFDRGGTDVVLYQYEDDETIEAVRSTGARVNEGIFSDISYLEHLGIKGFNWGVGYRDYHGPRAHAYLDDTFKMIGHYLIFHRLYEGRAFPHIPDPRSWHSSYRGSSYSDPWLEDDTVDDEHYDEDGYYMGPDYVNDYPTPEQLRQYAEAWLRD